MNENFNPLEKISKIGDGQVFHRILAPFAVEFSFKDVLQVIVGAALLSIPVSFTEEVWRLGKIMPMKNTIGLILLSILFISAFTYFNYYKGKAQEHWFSFLKRVVLTYVFSFITATILLILIQQAPWQADWILAFKRTAIVSFPAAMSGTLVDTLK